MIDLRIYRATFILALFAAIVAMFSLQQPSKPQSAALAPDAFDGAGAYADVERIAAAAPDRRPGSKGDGAVARLIAVRLGSLGYDVSRQRFKVRSNGRKVSLENVVGVLSGDLDRRVVIVAHRDSTTAPGAGSSGSGTAALLELAGNLDKVAHRKTAVLVSTDGATAGAAGAAYFARHVEDAKKIDGVIVLDDIASHRPQQPYVLPWSASSDNSPFQLVRTVRRAVKLEVGRRSAGTGFVGQFIRLALPLTAREQGVLQSAGLPAVTITSRGELPRRSGGDSLSQVSPDVLGNFGRAALASYLALDRADRLETAPTRYVAVASRLLPSWAVSLVVLALLVPALIAAVDAFARARRRRERVAKWTLWVLSASLPFLAALLLGHLLSLLGLLPDLPSGFYSITPEPIDTAAAFSWASIVLVILAAILFRHQRAKRFKTIAGTATAPGAAVAVSLVLIVEIWLVWLLNPFAAAMMLPAAHLWMLAVQPDTGHRMGLLIGLLAGGLVLPALVVAYYALAFDIGLRLLYELVLVFSGNTLGLAQGLLLCLLAGSFVAVVSIAWAKFRAGGLEPEITVRGPKTYAGPGSLGGTESALKR